MNTIQLLLTISIVILLIWNIFLFYYHKKKRRNQDREYFELNAKLNFITAVASIAILLMSYLGWNVKDEILKKIEEPIKEMIKEKSNEIDTLLSSKNILKAGIYIVNDIEFKEKKLYRFKELKTIDNKQLPTFEHAPKLIINTNTGESLRIEKVTNEYFVLGKPIYRNFYLASEDENPDYPKILKFDVWIADYKIK